MPDPVTKIRTEITPSAQREDAAEVTSIRPQAKLLSCDPPELHADLLSISQEIREARQRPLFVLAAYLIDDDVCSEVHDWRQELKAIGSDNPIDLLINSPGGVLSSCYNVARLFSIFSNSWDALVPATAASGATLICLGSANVVMADLGRLSPLDPQVISKRREKFSQTERQSPLEAFEAVRYLRQEQLQSMDAAMKLLLDRRVAPHLALETASKIASDFVRPIAGKIEPYDLGAFALDSRVAIEYCRRVSNPANPQKKTQRQVNPRALVENYPAHEFVIDAEEAQALGFSVSEPGQELAVLFDRLRPQLEMTRKFIGLIPT